METKPRSKRGILIFCLVFLAVAGAIATTALFANNRRNLNHLMRSLGIPITETMMIPKPGSMEKFKGKRLKGASVMLDAYIFMPETRDMESAFLRNMQKDGETLCELFDRLGFTMSDWQPGSFAKKVNECWSEQTIPNPGKPDEPSSFFLMIKGAPDGTLISARAKFIFSDAKSREKVTDMAAKVLVEFAKATRWTEIGEERAKVTSLTPFATSLGGVSARLSNEFSGAGRYNLIFSRAAPLTRPQKRTEDFFDRTRFFSVSPENGGPQIAAEPAKI